MSQLHGRAGRQGMTNFPEQPDLSAIARVAQAEIEEAERSPDALEFGYYEAELKSLRDAAASLSADESHSRDDAQRP